MIFYTPELERKLGGMDIRVLNVCCVTCVVYMSVGETRGDKLYTKVM